MVTEQDEQTIKAILTTLNQVSYTCLIEINKLNESSTKEHLEKDINLLISNKVAIDELIATLFTR